MSDNTTDREEAERLLQQLNNHKVCRKCGADSDNVSKKVVQYQSPGNAEHGITYNKATDMLDVRCWRCGFQWSRPPEDRKELT